MWAYVRSKRVVVTALAVLLLIFLAAFYFKWWYPWPFNTRAAQEAKETLKSATQPTTQPVLESTRTEHTVAPVVVSTSQQNNHRVTLNEMAAAAARAAVDESEHRFATTQRVVKIEEKQARTTEILGSTLHQMGELTQQVRQFPTTQKVLEIASDAAVTAVNKKAEELLRSSPSAPSNGKVLQVDVQNFPKQVVEVMTSTQGENSIKSVVNQELTGRGFVGEARAREIAESVVSSELRKLGSQDTAATVKAEMMARIADANLAAAQKEPPGERVVELTPQQGHRIKIIYSLGGTNYTANPDGPITLYLPEVRHAVGGRVHSFPLMPGGKYDIGDASGAYLKAELPLGQNAAQGQKIFGRATWTKDNQHREIPVPSDFFILEVPNAPVMSEPNVPSKTDEPPVRPNGRFDYGRDNDPPPARRPVLVTPPPEPKRFQVVPVPVR